MPKSPRQTQDPLGKKFLQVLREKGRPDDLNYLAEVFGVKVQSTYDWINLGRFAKERYARLVEWSGRPLEWWFDVNGPVRASEPAPGTSSWPFPAVDEAAVAALPRDTLLRLEGALLLVAAQLGLNLKATDTKLRRYAR